MGETLQIIAKRLVDGNVIEEHTILEKPNQSSKFH